MTTCMKPSALGPGLLLLLASVVLLFPLPVHAGGRRRVVAVSPPLSAPQLVIVGAAVVDAGTIAWRGGSRRSSVTTRNVTMRIGEPSREPRGTATLRAFVEAFDPRCAVRIDGVPLTTAPRVIRRLAPIGIAFNHRIEIEVPVAAADGPLQVSIGWEVTTE